MYSVGEGLDGPWGRLELGRGLWLVGAGWGLGADGPSLMSPQQGAVVMGLRRIPKALLLEEP